MKKVDVYPGIVTERCLLRIIPSSTKKGSDMAIELPPEAARLLKMSAPRESRVVNMVAAEEVVSGPEPRDLADLGTKQEIRLEIDPTLRGWNCRLKGDQGESAESRFLEMGFASTGAGAVVVIPSTLLYRYFLAEKCYGKNRRWILLYAPHDGTKGMVAADELTGLTAHLIAAELQAYIGARVLVPRRILLAGQVMSINRVINDLARAFSLPEPLRNLPYLLYVNLNPSYHLLKILFFARLRKHWRAAIGIHGLGPNRPWRLIFGRGVQGYYKLSPSEEALVAKLLTEHLPGNIYPWSIRSWGREDSRQGGCPILEIREDVRFHAGLRGDFSRRIARVAAAMHDHGLLRSVPGRWQQD